MLSKVRYLVAKFLAGPGIGVAIIMLMLLLVSLHTDD